MITVSDSDRNVHLRLTKLRQLDAAIVDGYQAWVTSAPPHYQKDGFLHERYPVAITSRYGQNQEIGVDIEDMEEEGLNWYRDRQFSRIRYMSVAIATHLR